jgi:hypothetical protein
MLDSKAPTLADDITYENVVIRLRKQTYYADPLAFQAEIRQSPEPLHSGAFRVNSKRHLDDFQKLFEQGMLLNRFFYNYATPSDEFDPQSQLIANEMETLGNELYELMPISIRDGLPILFQRVFERGRGVRLIVEARAGDQADKLLSLPWELLHLEGSRVYPGRSPRLIVLRRLLDAVRHSPVHLKPPLNLVHVIADSPSAPILPELQQAERSIIPEAIQPGSYALVEKPGSIKGLLNALQGNRVQIVHFLGHGEQLLPAPGTESSNTRRYMRFVGSDNQPERVTGEQLQHLLSKMPGVQVVVLNACQGASIVSSNIAMDLVYSGFPYVVTMQSELPQAAARHFIHAFYRELQRGQPVDYAVAAGRFAIAAYLPGSADWCLPVIYTSWGLTEIPMVVETANRIGYWWGQPNTNQWIIQINFILGIIQICVGLLLYLSHRAPPLPAVQFMEGATFSLALASPLLLLLALISKSFSVAAEGLLSISWITFITRMWGTSAIGVSLPLIYIVALLILLASVGFWEMLSLPAQLIILIPLVGLAAFNGYGLVLAHGMGYLANNQVERISFNWNELVIPLCGYLTLFAPLAVFYFIPWLLQPPLGNLIVGALCVALGYSLYAWSSNRDIQQKT